MNEPTQKLYYENPYLREFVAEVIEVTEKDGNFHILLDKTAFYPEGGGQPSDTGTLDDCPITSVFQEGGQIYHVSPKKPIKLRRAKGYIDWDRRFDGMQQHLSQHILSACFFEKFKALTMGFHLGNDICTVDIDKSLSSEQLDEIEAYANQIVLENFKLEILYPSSRELKKMPLRKLSPKIEGDVRIVKIGELDYNACGGIHPQSTIEVQLITILKQEKYKTLNRITFVGGKRAISLAKFNQKFTRQVCSFLKSNEEQAISKIELLSKSTGELSAENRKLKSIIADYEVKDMLKAAPSVKGIKIIKKIFKNIELKDVQSISAKLASYPGVVALLGVVSDQGVYMVFSCSQNLNSLDMNLLLKDSITLIDGKGGGNKFSSQGGGKSASNLESALDYAFSKLERTI
ncbi:MAG: DHHA1 domain-containing protein [Proteocatella sp.]